MSNLSDIRRFNMPTLHLTLSSLFITIFTVAILSTIDLSLTYFLVFILLIVTLIPIIIGLASKSLDIFELIYPISAIYFLYFGVRTIYILSHPEDMYKAYWGIPPAISFHIINVTLGYTSVGFIFLMAGYYSFIPKVACKFLPKLRLLNSSLKGRGIVKKIYLIYMIGIFFRLVLLSRGFGLSSLPKGADITFLNIMTLFSTFALFGYALYSIWLCSSPKNARSAIIPWLIMLIIEVGWALLSGWKGAFIPLVAIPIIAYHYLRQRLRIRHILLVAIAGLLILIFFVFPVINTYRVIIWQEGPIGSARNFLPRMGMVFNKLRQCSWSEYQQLTLRPFMNRLVGLDSFSMIVKDTPEVVDFQKGRTLSLFFMAWIPRFLWQEKPIIDVGRWFAINYWNLPSNVQTSNAPTDVGELYLNFHVVGIICGMFLFGIIYRVMYLYFIKYRRISSVSIFFYAFVFLSLIAIEGNIAVRYIHLLVTLFLLLLISCFLKIKIIKEV